MRLAEDLCGCCGTGRLKLGRSLNIFPYESLARDAKRFEIDSAASAIYRSIVRRRRYA
jgi:hypothetical protein